jgi:hypothetical protein
MTFRDRLANFLFPNLTAELKTANARLAAISARVDDSRGWDTLTPGPADRPWSERADDLDDVLEAWRKNFLIRRLVTLTRSYVVGNGISISSKLPEVDDFVQSFWHHRKNLMPRRLGPMCDELTRAGELFPVLHTNLVDGMSYIRFVPASLIRQIDTAENDYEVELQYGELQTNTVDLKWWQGPGHKNAFRTRYNKLSPLMLHFSVNKPIGATRGEGDLGPVLPWAKRYSEWLKDRVRLNRQRTRQGVLDIEIADPDLVEDKRQQLRTRNPIEAGIYVHGPGETVAMHDLNLRASDAGEDGKVLRLAIATGSHTALHYLGEGEAVNYSTAKEMGEPTARFHTDRQTQFSAFLLDVVEVAYRRRVALGLATMPPDDDLQLTASVTEVARADNLALAQASHQIVQALAQMIQIGIVDLPTAARLAFKFAGEVLDEEEISTILANAPEPTAEEEPSGNGDRENLAKHYTVTSEGYPPLTTLEILGGPNA